MVEMITFLVNLIRVPRTLMDAQLRELEVNECRHIEGRWWIFEGDEDALETPCRFVAEGVTGGLHRDDVPDGQPIIDHAVDIFRLGNWPPTI
jgi:hypothetical protein